jgi:hypothetical protein
MPWTPFHPAFALPFLGLSRRPFVLASLVIGSMAPDIPYFLLIHFVSWGHKFPALFLFGVPVSLVFAYFWTRFIREPVYKASPIKWRHELIAGKLDWQDGLFGVVAATIGIMTHIGIDSFTHAPGIVVQHWPLLRGSFTMFGRTTLIWHLLQYSFSAIGFGILVMYIAFNVVRKPLNRSSYMFWTRAGICAAVFTMVVGALRYPFEAVTILGVIMISSVIVGVIFATLTEKI